MSPLFGSSRRNKQQTKRFCEAGEFEMYKFESRVATARFSGTFIPSNFDYAARLRTLHFDLARRWEHTFGCVKLLVFDVHRFKILKKMSVTLTFEKGELYDLHRFSKYCDFITIVNRGLGVKGSRVIDEELFGRGIL